MRIIGTENGTDAGSESRSMVGTRHAVSDNNSKSGLGMPSPYNPEREQIQDRKAGLKRRTENWKVTRELGVF